MIENSTIAIVQQGPEFLDLPKSLNKARELIFQASKNGASLIVFGETWLSGYPIWIDYCPEAALWDHDPVKEVWSRTFQNGIEAKGDELKLLSTLAKDQKVNIIIGANEVITTGKGNGTIYNSIFTINNEGHLVNHHRKLMPTFSEKLIYGLGDGAGLKSVDLDLGRVGSLICWEHWMPLARQAMHDQSEEIHFALWPTVKEMNKIASRQYAFEGRCYVIAVGQTMQANQLPVELDNPFKGQPNTYILNGGSSIYGPDGSIILETAPNESTTFYFNLPNSKTLLKEKMNLAVSGHYQRNDIFQLNINDKRLI